MQFLVTHLTRMHHGHICVAGIDLHSGSSIRPVLSSGVFLSDDLAINGGFLSLGAVLDIDSFIPRPNHPHIEDISIRRSDIYRIGEQSAVELWPLLVKHSVSNLKEIFGSDLVPIGVPSCGVPLGKGNRSLGYLITPDIQRLYIKADLEGLSQVRMKFSDGDFSLNVSVTDVRLYEINATDPCQETVDRVYRYIREGTSSIVLSIGLTREFNKMHYVQVNNIHFRDTRDLFDMPELDDNMPF